MRVISSLLAIASVAGWQTPARLSIRRGATALPAVAVAWLTGARDLSPEAYGPALEACGAAGFTSVVFAYCFDPTLLNLGRAGDERLADARAAVSACQAAARARGSDVVVREGPAGPALLDLCAATSATAVYVADDVVHAQLAARRLAARHLERGGVGVTGWAAPELDGRRAEGIPRDYPSFFQQARWAAGALPRAAAVAPPAACDAGQVPALEALLQANAAAAGPEVAAVRAAVAAPRGEDALEAATDPPLEAAALEYAALAPQLALGAAASVPPACAEFEAAHDWHYALAAGELERNAGDDGAALEYRYWRWRGHLIRYGLNAAAVRREAGETTGGGGGPPPLVLVHGFGASAANWELLAQEMPERPIYAVDLVGFGHAEKPPLSYTQYLWERQARDFVLEVVGGTCDIAGNSIGGYVAMAAAAGAAPLVRRCALLNTAGRVLSAAEYAAEGAVGPAALDGTAEAKEPPPKWLANAFASGLLWGLRGNVRSICENVYPVNPDAVSDLLVADIVRDSLDPGAKAVLAAGAALPAPRTHNELMAQFKAAGGEKVAVVQGRLDPLNDAVGRAEAIVAVDPALAEVAWLEAGHCPHDEVPVACAAALRGVLG